MIIQKEFIEKLKDLGLNSYEGKIWTALLSRGVSTAGELSDIANVPRSRSYDVLESLEKKGFIVMKLGKPIKYVALPPQEVVTRVKKKIEEDADFKTRLVDQLRDSPIIEELTELHNKGVDMVEPTEISGSLKSRESLYDHIEMMIKSAEEEVIVMTTADGFIRKVDKIYRHLKKAGERGVSIRIVTQITPEVRAVLPKLEGIAEVRECKNVRARFCIVDNKEIAFMLMDDQEVHPNYDSGVWVNTPFFTQALKKIFEVSWESMDKVPVLK